MRTGDAVLPLIVLAAAACGGAKPEPARVTVVAASPVDAGVVEIAPTPDAPPPDPCEVYALAVRGPLSRIAQAGELFLDRAQHGAPDPATRMKGLLELADAIDAERRVLSTIHVGVAEIDDVHAGLDVPLAQLSLVLRVAADPTHSAEAGPRFMTALHDYQVAVVALQVVCPTVE